LDESFGKRRLCLAETNFRACACGQAALIGIFNPDLALWVFTFSYILVGFLFEIHSNPRQ